MLVIERYVPINKPESCVVAELDVLISEWKFRIGKIQECRKGDKHWFNWPSKYEEDPSGKGKFIPVACFTDEEVCKRFFTTLREEVKKHSNTQEDEEIPF